MPSQNITSSPETEYNDNVNTIPIKPLKRRVRKYNKKLRDSSTPNALRCNKCKGHKTFSYLKVICIFKC